MVEKLTRMHMVMESYPGQVKLSVLYIHHAVLFPLKSCVHVNDKNFIISSIDL
jgi:hypothetical protein